VNFICKETLHFFSPLSWIEFFTPIGVGVFSPLSRWGYAAFFSAKESGAKKRAPAAGFPP